MEFIAFSTEIHLVLLRVEFYRKFERMKLDDEQKMFKNPK